MPAKDWKLEAKMYRKERDMYKEQLEALKRTLLELSEMQDHDCTEHVRVV